MRERTMTVWRSFTVSPGTTSARSTTVSTSRPRQARMIRRPIAGEQHERLDPRALVDGRAADAEALRLVHAPAARGDRRERLARHRIPAADLDLHDARTIRHVRRRAGDGHAGTRIRGGGAQADVVDDATRLPGAERAELFGERRG